MKPKSFFVSKTNLFALIILLLGFLGGDDFLQWLKGIGLGEATVEVVAGFISLMIMALRKLTKRPVAVLTKPDLSEVMS